MQERLADKLILVHIRRLIVLSAGDAVKEARDNTRGQDAGFASSFAR